MPVWNTGEKWLHLAVQSVMNQTYGTWELCIADGNSSNPKIKDILNHYGTIDSRIKIALLPENKGIAGNTNEALKLATGEYVCFLDHDDTLSDNCLYEIARVLNQNQKYDIVYSDNDIIDEKERRKAPFFKFGFSLPAFLSTNYPFHLFVCRKSLIDSIGGLRDGFEGAQDYDLNLRVIEKTTIEKIAHIDKILYHWRALPSSSAGSPLAKPYAYEAGKHALEEYLVRNNIQGEVSELDPGSYRVKKRIVANPRVIIAVLSDNKQVNETFIAFFRNLVSVRTHPIDLISVPPVYADCFKDLNVHVYEDISRELPYLAHRTEDCRIIFVDGTITSCNSSHVNAGWIESLIEHFGYFNVGLVGTGSLTFANIICNVQRTCGPVFCVDKDLLSAFCKQQTIIADFDALQIRLSDFANMQGLDNLYTPFCIGNLPRYPKISEYYATMQGRYFTRNMRFYLPDYLNKH